MERTSCHASDSGNPRDTSMAFCLRCNMAEISKQWREYQEEDYRKRAAILVEDAIIRYGCDRETFFRLERYAGMALRTGETLEQKALKEELRRVCDGDVHTGQ